MNLKRYGVIAGWAAWFQPAFTPAAGATLDGMYLSLVFHDTPEDAERTYRYVGGVTGIQHGDEGETIADAVSMITGSPTVSGIIIRQGTVTAAVVMLHGENP